ncbi:Uncharacterised protein [Mycobacteroides abscessus subsp. abscessus]|nr:Uncharacterised protein [Mycobacteroides abscessus subsp. abscessus]
MCCGVVGQEEVAHTELPVTEVADPRQLGEEAQREIEVDAGAVSDALRGHSPAMRYGAERFVELADDVMSLDAILAGQESDAAATFLLLLVIQPVQTILLTQRRARRIQRVTLGFSSVERTRPDQLSAWSRPGRRR